MEFIKTKLALSPQIPRLEAMQHNEEKLNKNSSLQFFDYCKASETYKNTNLNSKRIGQS